MRRRVKRRIMESDSDTQNQSDTTSGNDDSDSDTNTQGDADDGDSSWSPGDERKAASRLPSKPGLKRAKAVQIAKQRSKTRSVAAHLLDTRNKTLGRQPQKRRLPRALQRQESEPDSGSDWEDSCIKRSGKARQRVRARRSTLDWHDAQSDGSEAASESPSDGVLPAESSNASSSSKGPEPPKVAKILARRPVNGKAGHEYDGEYLVLYKGLSYRQASWVSGEELVKADPMNLRRLQCFKTSALQPEEVIALQNGTHEFLHEDRILHAQRDSPGPPARWRYLVKWQGLGYSEATWELGDELARSVVEEYWLRKNRRPRQFSRVIAEQCRRIPTAAAAFDAQIQEHPHSEGDATSSVQHRLIFRPRAPLEIFDFQATGVRWLLQRWQLRQGGCILADEMGLGKTVQAALFLSIVARLWQGAGIGAPFLVISPMSVTAQWRAELAKWAPELRVVLFQGSKEDRLSTAQYEWWKLGGRKRDRHEFPGFDVCITSYDTLWLSLNHSPRQSGKVPWLPQKRPSRSNSGAGRQLFTSFPWGICIMDECTRMKSVSSKLRQQYMREVFPNVDHHVLLTATPIQNDIGELWSLLNIADPSGFADRHSFERQYGQLTTEDTVQALQKKLEDYLLQRRKAEVLAQLLPRMEEVVINIELTVEQKKLHRAIFERNIDVLRSYSSAETRGNDRLPSLMNLSMQLRKVCNHPYLINGVEDKITEDLDPTSDACLNALVLSSGKTVVLDKILRKAWNEGERVLVFSQFTMILDLLEDLLRGRGYPYERLDGNVNVRKRQDSIKRFNTIASSASGRRSEAADSDIEKAKGSSMQVFLISTRAGGLGLNLAAASVCVLFDCDWNPQNDLQAMARCHRIGQHRNVHVYRLITKNTYEAGMFRMASKKLGLTQAVMDSVGAQSCDLISKPSSEDVESLLRQGAFAAFDVEDEDACRADERSFDEILQSDDVEVLGPNQDTSSMETATQGQKRFRKMFFGSSPDSVAGHISVDDPNFWTKIANLCSEKKAKKKKQDAAKKMSATRSSFKRYRLRFKQSPAGLYGVREV